MAEDERQHASCSDRHQQASQEPATADGNCQKAANPDKASSPPLEAAPKRFGSPTSTREGYELRAVGSQTGDFGAYLREAPGSEVVAFFRGIARELQDLQLSDFHFKLQNNYDSRARRTLPGWSVAVMYGGASHKSKDGPLQVDRCMSCDLECPLGLGVLGDMPGGPVQPSPVSADSLLKEDATTRCWLDAKARPMIVVTPRKHAETMLDLSDEQLLGLWQAAAWSLRQLRTETFTSMILNHGNRRNHAHLHLKIRVRQPDFDRARSAWPEDWRAKLGKVQAFADSLPQDRRGTYQAYQLRLQRQRDGQQQGQQGQEQGQDHKRARA